MQSNTFYYHCWDHMIDIVFQYLNSEQMNDFWNNDDAKILNLLKDTSSSKSKVRNSADFMFEPLSTVAYVDELNWGF